MRSAFAPRRGRRLHACNQKIFGASGTQHGSVELQPFVVQAAPTKMRVVVQRRGIERKCSFAEDPLNLTHPLAVMPKPLPPPLSLQLLPPQPLQALSLPLPPNLLLRQPPQVRLRVREELVHEILFPRGGRNRRRGRGSRGGRRRRSGDEWQRVVLYNAEFAHV